MILFNAFQLVLLFATGPFIITYVNGAEFYAHHVLFWVLLASYIVGFAGMVASVAGNLEK